ncbi:hypothetical protein [Geobacter pickeringii]|uniref:Periplasmic heavy metal sensor n=1 Tax=Geobacter pickeringii TaxID=345632 RepID=A0A0B5BIM0_9BACT|nr:hypothetical protein [Geobacter pickeringii]AJE03881.1 hypothetical protein GPICK_11425 [Geobacter pickeringii]
MRKVKLAIAAATALAALAGLQQGASAETTPADAPAMGHGKMGRHEKMQMMDPAERLQRMTRHLGLTDDQKAKIQPILEEEAKELKALRDDTSLSRSQKRDKLHEIRTRCHDRIREMLTPEQQKKMDEMREKARERGEQKKAPMKAPPEKQQ